LSIKILGLFYLVVGFFTLLTAIFIIFLGFSVLNLIYQWQNFRLLFILGAYFLVSSILLISAFFGFYFQKKHFKFIGLAGCMSLLPLWIPVVSLSFIRISSIEEEVLLPMEILLILLIPLLLLSILLVLTIRYWKNLP